MIGKSVVYYCWLLVYVDVTYTREERKMRTVENVAKLGQREPSTVSGNERHSNKISMSYDSYRLTTVQKLT
jgi:hypothetical protein